MWWSAVDVNLGTSALYNGVHVLVAHAESPIDVISAGGTPGGGPTALSINHYTSGFWVTGGIIGGGGFRIIVYRNQAFSAADGPLENVRLFAVGRWF